MGKAVVFKLAIATALLGTLLAHAAPPRPFCLRELREEMENGFYPSLAPIHPNGLPGLVSDYAAHQAAKLGESHRNKLYVSTPLFPDRLKIRRLGKWMQKPLRLEVSGTTFPYPGLKPEIVTDAAGTEFGIANLGTRQLQPDLDLIGTAVKDLLDATPGKPQPVTVLTRGPLKDGLSQLSRLREATLEKVMDTYLGAGKGYLDERDLIGIRNHSAFERETETLVLLKDPHLDLTQATPAELKDNLLLTIQLSFYDPAHSVAPTTLQDYLSPFGDLHSRYNPKDSLPHQYRIQDEEAARAASRQLQALAKNHRIAELTRYAKFGDVPPRVHAALLRDLFRKAKDPKFGADVLIMSVDEKTRKQFARYRFSELGAFSPKGEPQDAAEYLLYLKVDSPEFEATLRDLESAASDAP